MSVLTMKQNDLEPSFDATLLNGDGTPINLTGMTSVSLVIKATVGNKSFKALGSIIDPIAALVRYRWALGDTDTVGIYNGEWEGLWPTNRPQTIPNSGYFTVVIEPDLG